MKIALVICNDMHMDIANANIILNNIVQTDGYEVVCDYTIADIIIVLTCAFGPNKMYSMRVIADIRLNAMRSARIIVSGCLVKLYSEDLKNIPGIEVKTFKELQKEPLNKLQNLIPQNKVIISTGCLHKCSYCVYPMIVGKYKSKTVESILAEIDNLYENESTIYITGAQETSDYGVDLYGTRKFATLMQKILEKYPNCNYIIGWFHPAGLTEELMSVITNNKNITEIMLHIQHVSDKILQDMNRTQFKDFESKLKTLKKLRPDLVISTEVIVGFPGETDAQFKELVNVLKKGYFSDIGVASYEAVEGTLAAKLPNQISTSEKKRRMEYIKSTFSATCYPADENSSQSIIDEYLKAYSLLQKLPQNVLVSEERQKYNLIAGTDTNEKLTFSNHFNYVVHKITNARSDFDKKQCKKMFSVYTDEAKTMFYEIIRNGNFKPALKERARYLLL